MKSVIRRNYVGRWIVYQQDGERISFPTYAQAIAHADEIARTVTVTLPPYRSESEVDHLEIAKAIDHTRISDTEGARFINVREHAVKPLALALLATAHYRERKNQ